MILNAEGKSTRPLTRVAISVPTGDQVAAGFSYDLARMMAATASQRKDIELRLHYARSTILPEGRRDLVRMALEAECTHILFLDSDMRFPKDTLVRLLAHRDPVVAANYTKRRFPNLPVARTPEGAPLFVEEGASGLAPASMIGMGVMLVDLDVFRRLPEPWFQVAYLGDTGEYMGEDVYFCALLREHGLTVLADLALSHDVGHLGELEYRSEHALELRDLVRPDEAPTGGPQ